jgi:hypothetical protein
MVWRWPSPTARVYSCRDVDPPKTPSPLFMPTTRVDQGATSGCDVAILFFSRPAPRLPASVVVIDILIVPPLISVVRFVACTYRKRESNSFSKRFHNRSYRPSCLLRLRTNWLNLTCSSKLVLLPCSLHLLS